MILLIGVGVFFVWVVFVVFEDICYRCILNLLVIGGFVFVFVFVGYNLFGIFVN